MEEPAVLAELGDVRGVRVLDLGCGDARFGKWLLEQGVEHYHGVDSSAGMVRLARTNLSADAAHVTHSTIEGFRTTDGSVELVVSRLALHYVEPLDDVLNRCRQWLAPGGRLLITVLHPVITSHDARPSTNQLRTSWLVDEYFRPGPRPQEWLGGSVLFHHRTVEQYVRALSRAGFHLTALSECPPQWEAFDGDQQEFDRRRRIPLFLLLGAR